MSLHEAFLEPYRHRGPQLIVALTAGIVFLKNVVISWQEYFRLAPSGSFVEWAVFAVGSVVLEPILLFGALYYVSTRWKRCTTLVGMLPGLLVAAFVGGYVGQTVGGELWELSHGFVWLAGRDLLSPTWILVIYVREAVLLVARDVLTAVAAIALARERHHGERGVLHREGDDDPAVDGAAAVRR